MKRTAKTAKGKTVVLNETTETAHGWTSYVVDRRGFAVAVFVPKN